MIRTALIHKLLEFAIDSVCDKLDSSFSSNRCDIAIGKYRELNYRQSYPDQNELWCFMVGDIDVLDIDPGACFINFTGSVMYNRKSKSKAPTFYTNRAMVITYDEIEAFT